MPESKSLQFTYCLFCFFKVWIAAVVALPRNDTLESALDSTTSSLREALASWQSTINEVLDSAITFLPFLFFNPWIAALTLAMTQWRFHKYNYFTQELKDYRSIKGGITIAGASPQINTP